MILRNNKLTIMLLLYFADRGGEILTYRQHLQRQPTGEVFASAFLDWTIHDCKQDIDIADGRAGTANINREYISDDNPYFALHDSNGFEPGSTEHWTVIETFIRQRSQKNLPFDQRIHALW